MRYFLGFVCGTVLLAAAILFPKWWSARQASVDAFETAELRIATATGRSGYFLDFSDLPDLRRLPSDISTLENLSQIRLTGTKVTNLGPLAELPKLNILVLREMHIENLDALIELPKLQTLDIGKSWVFDLEPLTKIHTLERLDIGNTAIRSLEPATRMRKLKWLNLYNSYAHDGSQTHYRKLRAKGVDVFNGNPYKQNYIPDGLYKLKVRFKRWRTSWGLN